MTAGPPPFDPARSEAQPGAGAPEAPRSMPTLLEQMGGVSGIVASLFSWTTAVIPAAA